MMRYRTKFHEIFITRFQQSFEMKVPFLTLPVLKNKTNHLKKPKNPSFLRRLGNFLKIHFENLHTNEISFEKSKNCKNLNLENISFQKAVLYDIVI